MSVTFDQAFMLMTGHIVPLSTFEEAFLVLKTALSSASRDAMLWGPEAVLLTNAIVDTIRKDTAETVRDLQAQFDLSGDVSLHDEKKAKKLAGMIRDEVASVGPKMKNKVQAIASALADRAVSYYHSVRNPDEQVVVAKILNEEIETILSLLPERLASSLEAVAATGYEELITLINNTALKPQLRTIDTILLIQNIRNMMDRIETSVQVMTDVTLGKTWSYVMLQQMITDGVEEYLSVAEMDGRTCTVCLTLHGKIMQVHTVVDATSEWLVSSDAPPHFIRMQQIDNKPPEFFKKLPYSPPYHPNCRCTIMPLGVRATGEQSPPGTPPVIPQRKE